MEIKNRKSQITIIETIFMILLFFIFAGYLYGNDFNFFYNDYDYNSIDTAMISIYKLNNFRVPVFEEDMNVSLVTADWNSLKDLLDMQFSEYTVSLLDLDDEKMVINSTTKNVAYYSYDVFFFIDDYNNVSGFRYLRMRVY